VKGDTMNVYIIPNSVMQAEQSASPPQLIVRGLFDYSERSCNRDCMGAKAERKVFSSLG